MFMRFANFCMEKKLIKESEKTIWGYAAEELVHTTLIIASILFWGVQLEHIPESLVFLVVFPSVRRYVGGIHASSRLTCYITTIYMFLFSLWAVEKGDSLLLAFFALLASGYIYWHAPAENNNRILNLHQKKVFQKLGRETTLVFLCLGLFFIGYKNYMISQSVFVILILSSVNLFLQNCKPTLKKPIKTNHIVQVLSAMVLSFGLVSIRGACNHWNYQPELDADMRKYADN